MRQRENKDNIVINITIYDVSIDVCPIALLLVHVLCVQY